jgi:hypothetical protein
MAYHKAGEEKGVINRVDGTDWDEEGYRLDGWYLYLGCGEEGCCRPVGPFPTRMAACWWLSLCSQTGKTIYPDPRG